MKWPIEILSSPTLLWHNALFIHPFIHFAEEILYFKRFMAQSWAHPDDWGPHLSDAHFPVVSHPLEHRAVQNKGEESKISTGAALVVSLLMLSHLWIIPAGLSLSDSLTSASRRLTPKGIRAVVQFPFTKSFSSSFNHSPALPRKLFGTRGACTAFIIDICHSRISMFSLKFICKFRWSKSISSPPPILLDSQGELLNISHVIWKYDRGWQISTGSEDLGK